MNTTNAYKGTILVIDDMPDNVNILLEFLSQADFEVLVAQDGRRGIQKVEYAHPDLILLDIMMPGMDGFEVCRRLKSQPTTGDIPIIFMTALVDTANKVKGFKLGAADYITKPIQHEEVLARVTTHLNLHKLKKQLKEQNQQLLQRTSELERRNSELDAFAHTVAHDLKNPLSAIINLNELLMEECSLEIICNPRRLEKLQFINRSAQQMRNIIDALLMLARISRETQIEYTPLDMGLIVRDVIEERIVPLYTADQAIRLPPKWPTAQGYALWVKEIWANYLSNAFKYGGQPPFMELGADVQADGMLRFWIRDNGSGLTPEEQAQLFTPFTRLHKERAEGHGLGLSIVQQIVEKLGGQAGVESEIGHGSLFYFTLPQYSLSALASRR